MYPLTGLENDKKDKGISVLTSINHLMDKDFINKYCGVPLESTKAIIEAVTEQEIIKHFTTYIEEKCIDKITLIEYRMPEEFCGRIERGKFFQIICSFLLFQMEFEIYDPGSGKMEEIFDWNYETIEFKNYYCIAEIQNKFYPDYYQDFACLDINKITKIVFRIYKS